MTLRIGIVGYGNLGRGVECAVEAAEDMELAVVLTRRDPAGLRFPWYVRILSLWIRRTLW